jgi:hypothetical protein
MVEELSMPRNRNDFWLEVGREFELLSCQKRSPLPALRAVASRNRGSSKSASVESSRTGCRGRRQPETSLRKARLASGKPGAMPRI